MKIPRALLDWYKENARTLPWRDCVGSYSVWISEVMLQQTRCSVVIPYYQKFLEKYPTVEALSKSKEEEVLALWSGLGYYQRARNLRRTAQILMEKHQGELPKNLKDLLLLPGIGTYTARAILSIGYGKPYAVLDGNVRRVASRFFGLDLSGKKEETALLKKLESILDTPQAKDINQAWLNQAWMELGALVCLPHQGFCGKCPLSRDCFAFQNDRVQDFPKIAPKKKREEMIQVILVFHSYEHIEASPRKTKRKTNEKMREEVLLVQKKNSKILEGLWEFPNFLFSDPNSDLNMEFSFDSSFDSSFDFSFNASFESCFDSVSKKRKTIEELENNPKNFVSTIQEKICDLFEFSQELQKQKLEWVGTLSHSITYRQFRVYVYRLSWERLESLAKECQRIFTGSRWFDLQAIDSIPHSSLLSKVLHLLRTRGQKRAFSTRAKL